jgi:hypothetical protein
MFRGIKLEQGEGRTEEKIIWSTSWRKRKETGDGEGYRGLHLGRKERQEKKDTRSKRKEPGTRKTKGEMN